MRSMIPRLWFNSWVTALASWGTMSRMTTPLATLFSPLMYVSFPRGIVLKD